MPLENRSWIRWTVVIFRLSSLRMRICISRWPLAGIRLILSMRRSWPSFPEKSTSPWERSRGIFQNPHYLPSWIYPSRNRRRLFLSIMIMSVVGWTGRLVWYRVSMRMEMFMSCWRAVWNIWWNLPHGEIINTNITRKRNGSRKRLSVRSNNCRFVWLGRSRCIRVKAWLLAGW